MPDEEMLLPEIDFAHDELVNLHEVIEQLRTHGSVVRVKYHGAPTWAILSHVDVVRAFTDLENFNQYEGFKILAGPPMGHNLQTMEPAEHRVQRALVAGSFLPKTVREYVAALVEPVAGEIADRLEGHDEIDFVSTFARPFPFTVITRLLGIPVTDEPMLLKWAVKLIDFPWDPGGAMGARTAFDSYVGDIVTARRKRPESDLISTMIQAEFDGARLNDDEILSFCRLLFPAGSDTAYNGIGNMFSYVLANHEIKELAKRSDRDREAIVTESLRWETPLPMQPLLASGNVRFGDLEIKRGDWTLLCIAAANRDPAVFSDPHRFDPSRDNRHLISFGRGPHFCLGKHLALRELECALKVLLDRFPAMRLKPATPVEIVGGVLRGPRVLWVQPYGSG